MKAKDIMTTQVVTVGPDVSVGEIAKLMMENRISAVPVVDGAGAVKGIVSEGDLLRRVEAGTERKRSWWLSLVSDPVDEAHDFVKSHGQKASDVMTGKVVTVTEDTSLAEIAGTLEEQGIKRVPVVRDGKLVGIVSRANLLQAITAGKAEAKAPPSADDQSLRSQVVARLASENWANISGLNVIVTQGTAHLWGLADSDDERKALRIAVEEVPGIKGVVEHLGRHPSGYGGW